MLKTFSFAVVLALVGFRVGTIVFTQFRGETLAPKFSHPLTPEESKALSAKANRSNHVVKQARLLFEQRRFTEAIQVAKRALEMSDKINGEPSNIRAVQLLGDIYLEQKRYEDAIAAYNRARKHTRNAELDLNTALAYVRLGDLKNAHHFYSEEKFFSQLPNRQQAEYFPQLPGAKNAKSFEASLLFARGCEKSGYGDSAAATKDFQKALHLFPHNGLFAYQLALDLMRLKRYDEALPMWAIAAKFGKGETSRKAKNKMGGFSAVQREQAMRDVEKLQ